MLISKVLLVIATHNSDFFFPRVSQLREMFNFQVRIAKDKTINIFLLYSILETSLHRVFRLLCV